MEFVIYATFLLKRVVINIFELHLYSYKNKDLILVTKKTPQKTHEFHLPHWTWLPCTFAFQRDLLPEGNLFTSVDFACSYALGTNPSWGEPRCRPAASHTLRALICCAVRPWQLRFWRQEETADYSKHIPPLVLFTVSFFLLFFCTGNRTPDSALIMQVLMSLSFIPSCLMTLSHM